MIFLCKNLTNERMMVLDSLPPRCFEILILIVVIGILRCLEASADNASEAKLQRLAGEGDKGARRILKLLDNPTKFYNSMKAIMTVVELVAVYLGVQMFSEIFPAPMNPILSAALGITVLSVLMLILGVYVPKRIAALKADSVVLKTAGLMQTLFYIGLPVSIVLTLISNAVLMLFGIRPNDTEEEVTEEEIRMMVDIGSESGAIDQDEKEMIHNIFELDDTQAKDIMTHRTDTELLWMEEVDKWEEIISETNHSIYPVCSDSTDNITGILKSKDLYKALLTGGDVTELLRTPYFVPETIKADDLFRQMQKTKNHFAVVLDEYGGLGGIITMSDLLEEIVGTLSDDVEEIEEEEIIQVDENTWEIAGSCDIDLVSETLNVELPIEEYNTFAGMILSELGEIPEDGSTPELEAYGMQIKVKKILDHRIEYALVTVMEKVQDDE